MCREPANANVDEGIRDVIDQSTLAAGKYKKTEIQK